MKQRLRMVSLVAAAAALLAVAAPSLRAAQAARIDISGAWEFTVEIGGAVSGTPTVTFKQDGEKITGHYSSMTLGEQDFTGTLKGQDLAFNFTADLGGQSAPVAYNATVANKDSMKGTIDIAGLANGTFTGKRK